MAEGTDYRQDVAGTASASLERTETSPEHGEEHPRSDDIRRDIDATRAALDQKLDALQTKVRHVQTKAKETFNLNHQFHEHPWAMFGASLGVGFALGMMFGGEREEHHYYGYSGRQSMMYEPTQYSAQTLASSRQEGGRSDIFDTLKLAAGAAVTDLVRQTIKQYVPALGQQLDKIWQERGITPTSVANAFFTTRKQDKEQQLQSSSTGSTSYGSTDSSYGASGSSLAGANYSGTGQDLAQDYNPSVEPGREAAVRGEVTSRS